MAFHRLLLPAYFGGLPGGYDYINDPAANGDPGVPTAADGKKASGPNEGTYLVALQEPASSANTNRGLQALAENTDLLDDILRRDLNVPVQVAFPASGSPVTDFTIPGVVFVGDPSYVGDPKIFGLVQLVDPALFMPLTVDLGAGQRYPVLATDLRVTPAGVSVIGATYHTNPVVIVNPPIPAGVAYVVTYYVRDKPATHAADILTPALRNSGVWEPFTFAAAANAAGRYQANTFVAGFTQTFNEGATFLKALLRSASMPDATPLLHSPTAIVAGDIYVLMGEFEGDLGIRSRIYMSGAVSFAPAGRRGLVMTTNARWDQGTLSWVADVAADRASKFLLGPNRSGFELKTIPAATWGDGSWDHFIGAPSVGSATLTATSNIQASLAISSGTTVTAGTDVRATSDFEYVAPRLVKKSISVATYTTQYSGPSVRDWIALDAGSTWTLRSLEDFGKLAIPLNVPAGVTGFTVRVLLNPGAARAGANRMALAIKSYDHDFSTSSVDTATARAVQFDDATTDTQTVTLVDPGPVIVGTESLLLEIAAGSTGSTQPDSVYGIELEYSVGGLNPTYTS